MPVAPKGSSLNANDFYLGRFSRKNRHRAARAAGVGDKGVFQIHLDHFERTRVERFGEFLMFFVVADNDQLQLAADLPAADQALDRRESPAARLEIPTPRGGAIP